MKKPCFLSLMICFFAISVFIFSAHAARFREIESRQVYSPDMEIDRVIIKFAEDLKVRLNGDRLESVKADLQNTLTLIEEISGKSPNALFTRNQADIDRERSILQTEKSLQLPDLNSYYQIETDDYKTALELIEGLKNNPYIEKAYIRPKSYPAGDIDPPTPDYTSEQGYLFAAPEGLDAEYAWSVPGGMGENVHVIDIEGNWYFDHEDFGDNIDTLLFGTPVNVAGWASHGSCVIGIIGADSNGYGITGFAPKAMVSTVSIGTIGVASAIDYAASQLEAGDVILIELNTPGPRYDFEFQADQQGYVPEEYFDETFDAVQFASAKGIIVCAVAGNGYEDLDDAIYEDRFNTSFRDSRAVFVGAGAPPSGTWGNDRSRLYFSNYGSRVNLQGWGKEVVASGYGILFDGDGDYRQYYTNRFNGTSSAAAMVAGAITCLQSAYQEQFGYPMIVEDMVYLLDLSGTMQPNPTENIGPRPDLQLALLSIQGYGSVTVEPLYVEHTMIAGESGQSIIFLTNNYTDRTIDYDITFDDTVEGWETSGWLAISPLSGSIDANDAVVIPFMFDGAEIPGSLRPYKAYAWIELSLNPGYDTIFVPVFLNLECNDTSYTVLNSDQGQITYEWIDITSTGTLIEDDEYQNEDKPLLALDDGTAGPYDLGFSFNFYNSYFNRIYIATNGALSFVESDMIFDGYFDDIYFPLPGFNAFISPFWNDLSVEGGYMGNGGIYYYRSPASDSFVVSYESVGYLGQAEDTTITFQVIFTEDGIIRFQYKDTGIGGAPVTSLVGMTLEQDCRYIGHYDRYQSTANMPHNLLALEFRPNYEFTYLIGDANNDGYINVSDAVRIINYVFIGGAAPSPLMAGDTNCDGAVNISDAVKLINYVFIGGYAPGDIDGDGIPDC